jgi:tetratricopeptide (TPR) repeat protein
MNPVVRLEDIAAGRVVRMPWARETAGVVFVADDLGAWLVGLLADAGRRKLAVLVLGSEQERALRQAAAAAVQLTAGELAFGNGEHAGRLAMVISEVFREPVPDGRLAGQETLLEALHAGVAEMLAVLDDVSLTGTGQSSAGVLGVQGSVVAEKLAGHLVREVMLRGSRGGPLAPLAGQLNHDVTHLQGRRLEDLLARLADEVRMPAWAGSGAAVSLAAPLGRRAPERPLRGRSALLDELAGAWDDGFEVEGIQVLYGLGGCGKTSIALELAARVRHEAGGTVETWWVSAADSRQFRAGMIALAFRVGVTEEQVRHGEAADLLWQRLAERPGKWLLVVDNADDPGVLAAGSPPVKEGRGWLRPPGHGSGLVVVTTRDGREATWGTLARLRRVGVLADDDAAQVLIDYAGSEAGSRKDAVVLARRLGGLPLALRLAGSYLRESASRPAAFADHATAQTFAGYQFLLDRGQVGADHSAGEQFSEEDARGLVGQAWDISLDMLTAQGMGYVRPLLRLLACFAHAPVPYELLLRPAMMAETGLFPGLTGPQLWDSLLALEAFGFIDFLAASHGEQTVSALQLHLLVRDASRSASSAGGETEAYFGLAGTLCASAAASPEAGEPENPDAWPQWEALTPHCAHLLAEVASHASMARDVASAAHAAAWYLSARGRYQEAEQLFRHVEDVRERVLGSGHPDTLAAGQEVAWMLAQQGRTAEAEELYRRVLAGREQALGDDHPDTLTTRSAVAWMLGERGRFGEAEELYRQVLAASGRVLGDGHPNTLATRSSVAWMLGERGRYEEAEDLYRQVLAGREEALGNDHSDTLATRGDVARMLGEQGRSREAEDLYRQVLAGREEALGNDHPDTLATRIAVARMLEQQDRYQDAEQLYRQVLEDSARVLGDTHPLTLTTRHGIARMLEEQSRYQDAEQLYLQVLAVREQVYGADHPHTLITRSSLLNLQALHGRDPEAEHGLRAVAEAQARVIGRSHPATLVTRHALARAIFKQGRSDEAEQEAAAVLSERIQVLGPQHPRTRDTQDLLAQIRRSLGRG